ncbi:MAG: 30S ribosomal protein S6 [Candidatus Promineifilaceae bacterium]
MRDYEITVVLKGNLEEEARNELIERLLGWIGNAKEGAAEPMVEHWGLRQLAYPISKETEGYYVFVQAQMEPTQVAELERNMQFVDDILRHLVVRHED